MAGQLHRARGGPGERPRRPCSPEHISVAAATGITGSGCHSAIVLPEPPNSDGKSLNLVSPSFMGSTVSP